MAETSTDPDVEPSRDPARLAADLCRALLTPRDEQEMARLLADLCTPAEVRTLAERWHVARLLAGDRSHLSRHSRGDRGQHDDDRPRRPLPPAGALPGLSAGDPPAGDGGSVVTIDGGRLHLAVQKSGRLSAGHARLAAQRRLPHPGGQERARRAGREFPARPDAGARRRHPDLRRRRRLRVRRGRPQRARGEPARGRHGAGRGGGAARLRPLRAPHRRARTGRL